MTKMRNRGSLDPSNNYVSQRDSATNLHDFNAISSPKSASQMPENNLGVIN